MTAAERGTTTAQTDLAWAAFSVLQTATTDYDPQGRKVRDNAFVGSVNPSITQYTYDTADRLICTAARMNPATFSSLPGSACTLATTGSFGPDRIAFNTYDALNRVLTTSDAYGTPLQRVTSTQAYTANGKPDWVEDALGNRSNYIYDAFDRLYRLEFPSTTVGAHAPNSSDYEEYGYDAANNPTTKRTRSAQLFTTYFDHLNRAILIDAPSPSNDVEYRYDLLNRRTSASHAVGVLPVDCASATICSSWDALGRQASETGPLGAMTYQYDLASRRTRMTWPDAVFVTYAWDLDGSMTAITLNGSSAITTYAYDNLARRTGITRGNGVPTTYVWDTASYLTSLTQNPTGSTYDLTYGFTHSPVGQVIGRTMSNSAYDFAPVNGSTAYSNNGLNQNTVVGGATLTWSTQGNLTSDGTKTFTYDAGNRLTGTTGSALTYDPLDRLYEMTGTGAGRFQYDGQQVAAVYPSGSSTVAERYVRGPTPDEWAVIYTGSGTGSPTYPLQNHQASVIALTDGSGVATSILSYDAYGLPRTGNLGRFQYTGQMMLPDFGLQHYKARAYNAALGRFMQTDPVGYKQGLNLYAYVLADPINNLDFDGLETVVALYGYRLGSALGVGNYGHSYVVMRDTVTGQSYTFRGGPTPGYAGGSAGAASDSASKNNGQTSVLTTQVDPSSASPDTKAGGYAEQHGGAELLQSHTVDATLPNVVGQANAISGSLNAAGLEYQPRSVNSNYAAAVAYEAITDEDINNESVQKDTKYPGIEIPDVPH